MDFDVVSRVLFPMPAPTYTAESFPRELICVPRSLNPQTSSAEDCVPFLLLRASFPRFLVIVFHSNFEDLGRCYPFCAGLCQKLGVHVLAAEYPGYGICPGSYCDERGATEVAQTAFRFAREVLRWPAEDIIVLGRSIGTGPAVALAAQHQVGGLILVSPFLSIKEAGRESLGPMANLIAERFPNQDLMPLVSAPCLIIHGQRDVMVPPRHGQQLHELCKSVKKSLVMPPTLMHNGSLFARTEYFVGPVREFFVLPQSGTEELLVPSWAFDQRLLGGVRSSSRSSSGSTTCEALGLGAQCRGVPAVPRSAGTATTSTSASTTTSQVGSEDSVWYDEESATAETKVSPTKSLAVDDQGVVGFCDVSSTRPYRAPYGRRGNVLTADGHLPVGLSAARATASRVTPTPSPRIDSAFGTPRVTADRVGPADRLPSSDLVEATINGAINGMVVVKRDVSSPESCSDISDFEVPAESRARNSLTMRSLLDRMPSPPAEDDVSPVAPPRATAPLWAQRHCEDCRRDGGDALANGDGLRRRLLPPPSTLPWVQI
eukprot:TRINITY_DN16161_c0_g1_i1.p1 TRINITY_DN16161_c0_g1~~TRINITY_DN16161_c0_g1_i1.p1  ORF type:complete len:546 (-),score=67.73 TRINITY_DN16161_c0_g1_i1:109-1746(-)